jgi:lysophospholipase L1-like esterase
MDIKENKNIEGKLSLRQKLILIFFGLLVALLLGETVFRIGGLIVQKTEVSSYDRKDKDIYRILCIGDSSTYGVGASDVNKFSYPSQLQKIFNENLPNRKFNVVNLGIPGINSSQVLNRFRSYLSKYNPDLVVVMIGINDPWNLEESNILKFYKENIFKRMYLGTELFLNRLRLYQFVKLVLISNKFKNPEYVSFPEKELNIPAYNDETRSKSFNLSIREPMKASALFAAIDNNITALKSIADDSRVNIIFMNYHNGGWGRPEKVIHQTYAKLNIPVVDNITLFQRAKEIGLNVRGNDHWHPNDLGYLLIARNIFNKMVALELVDSEPVKLFDN